MWEPMKGGKMLNKARAVKYLRRRQSPGLKSPDATAVARRDPPAILRRQRETAIERPRCQLGDMRRHHDIRQRQNRITTHQRLRLEHIQTRPGELPR